jgi:hypothetical protein
MAASYEKVVETQTFGIAMPICEFVSSWSADYGEWDFLFEIKNDGCTLGPGIFAVAKADSKDSALDLLKNALFEATDTHALGSKQVEGIEIEATHERIVSLIAVIPKSPTFRVKPSGEDDWKYCLLDMANKRFRILVVVRARAPEQAYLILRSEFASRVTAGGYSAIRIAVDSDRIDALIIVSHEQLSEVLDVSEADSDSFLQHQLEYRADDWFYPDEEIDTDASDQVRNHLSRLMMSRSSTASQTPLLRCADRAEADTENLPVPATSAYSCIEQKSEVSEPVDTNVVESTPPVSAPNPLISVGASAKISPKGSLLEQQVGLVRRLIKRIKILMSGT